MVDKILMYDYVCMYVCMYGSTSLPYVGIFACENEVCMYVTFITEHRHFIYASRSK